MWYLFYGILRISILTHTKEHIMAGNVTNVKFVLLLFSSSIFNQHKRTHTGEWTKKITKWDIYSLASSTGTKLTD